MLNKKGIRELAYVVQVDEINELPGYDRVESARIGGWRCIVPKGQFHVGSKGVYFEIDSLVPSANPVFAFMEKRNYKVKTQKMCKSISQGLLMAFEDFGWDEDKYEVGDFLTEILGVKYAEAEDNKRKANSEDKYKKMAQRHGKLFSKQPFRWLMRREWGKKLLFVFFGKKKDKKNAWPDWVVKTDEERIQNQIWRFSDEHKDTTFIATEKIDGTSTTFSIKRKGKKKFDYYVCSRNVVMDKPDKSCYYDSNVYLEMNAKYDMEAKMTALMEAHPEYQFLTIQAETYGAGIQKRDYGLIDHRMAVFNVIYCIDGVVKRLNPIEMVDYLTPLEIPTVPIVSTNFKLPATCKELLDIATDKSAIDGGMREGLVFRSLDGSDSFKAVSNEFLLKYHG